MGQIVKRRKKGRPTKVDPSSREEQTPERDLRRSLHRRNMKYVFDLDNYFDEDEVFADDEEQRRREKKLKLQSCDEPESTSSRDRRTEHASASSSDDDGKPSKKRKIDEEMLKDFDEEIDDEDNCKC